MSYDENYYNTNEQDSDRIALRWYSAILSRRLPNGSRVLDFGCGTGFFMLRLHKFFEVDGLDVSETARTISRQKLPNASFYSQSSTIASETYDGLTALHVLEHIEDPKSTLVEMYRILRPGGMALVVVPDTDGRGHKKKGEDWFAYKDPTHCTFLPSAEWAGLSRDAGFRVTIEGSDGLWDSPYSRLPRLLDRLVFGWPLILNVLSGTLNSRANKGECAVLLLEKPVS